MSRDIDDIITAYGQDTGDIASSSRARAELAQLRAQAAELAAARTALEQAREALEHISTIPPHFTYLQAISEAVLSARAWLSAHPAPQAEQAE